MRKTKQKEYIWEAVKDYHGHPTPENIYAILKPNHPKLSLATVYRNLNQFADRNMLVRVNLPNQPMCFDANMKPHLHAVCKECGEVHDLFSPEQAELEQLINRLTDMKVVDYNLSLDVICPNCQKKEQSATAQQPNDWQS